jgi:predicted Zn-dependent protease
MTIDEAKNTKPLRLKLVTVKLGDTIDSMARKMATDKKRERFLVLNGLNPGESLAPGSQVKIVVE